MNGRLLCTFCNHTRPQSSFLSMRSRFYQSMIGKLAIVLHLNHGKYSNAMLADSAYLRKR